MAARAFMSFIAALVLFTSFFPSDAGAWYCEGKECGITLGRCCCDDAAATDSDSARGFDDSLFGSHERQKSFICRAGCDCVMVMVSVPTVAPEKEISFSFPPVLLSPITFLHFMPVPTEARVIAPTASRGPPEKNALFSLPSLRAPPVV